jgi:phosphate transport system substrate-binding protein
MRARALFRLALCLVASAPFLARGERPPAAEPIRYAGSSTVALFLQDAQRVYPAARFSIDTGPESAGGERSIVASRIDLAGIADRPQPQTLRAGVVSTLIGRDAIAVVVNASNPVTNLTREDLRAMFTGRVRTWTEVGGPDTPVQPFIVAPGSATRTVFRAGVLAGADYAGCREIRPDRDVIAAVAGTAGGVGQISFSFLAGARGVRAVAIDGEEPSTSNFRYPVARPLYLLWREGNPAVGAFVRWTRTDAGQRVVSQRFVSTRVVDSVRAARGKAPTGFLVVRTQTYAVYDGGMYYYPHRPYDLLTRHGELVRHVENHIADNDEKPTRLEVPAETYLIRPETSRGDRPEFFVTIEPEKTTEVDVEALLRGGTR